MPILDEKGRLFNRFNLVDTVVVLCILGLTASIVVVKLLPNRARPFLDREWSREEVKAIVLVPRHMEWVLPMVKAGDCRMAQDGKVVASIEGKETALIPDYGTGVLVRVRLLLQKDAAGRFMYGGARFAPGQSFVFPTTNYVLQGIIYRIDGP